MSCRQCRRNWHLLLMMLGLVVVTAGCGLINELLPTSASEEDSETSADPTLTPNPSGYSPSSPTPYPTPTTGVATPEIQSPAPGAELTDPKPTLVVSNAVTQDKAPLYYSFELSGDESFAELIAEAQGVQEGKNERTAWQVPDALSEGRYFWRARAQAGYVKSPYSEVADFKITEIQETPAPEPGDGVASVFDPLTNGTSVGEVGGGKFTSEGWEVTNKSDFIRYEIQPLESGFVEWQNLGLRRANPSHDQYMLLGMWDPTRGDYRANPFRVHVQKLDANHNRPYVRLRWIADGEQHDVGYHFEDWDPQQVYTWRLEWGPSGSANEVRVFLDGQLIIRETYKKRYAPDVHWVELGIAERAESIVGTIYANLRIGSL